ncbi:hypothetical protein CCACVL1_28030 [Corchorus capsularis]|uniref:Uncharacterized protein n=1 Tax=Corchorus capsularis TaxID=210143 RepID=A0A1R3G801_COCAP|nr:hypothetical protein CCACVL1_28030 [Corchorus capsularis]
MDSKIQSISQNHPKIQKHSNQNNPKAKTANKVIKKLAFNPSALLVGATAGPSISVGEGAGEIPVNLLCL